MRALPADTAHERNHILSHLVQQEGGGDETGADCREGVFLRKAKAGSFRRDRPPDGGTSTEGGGPLTSSARPEASAGF